MEAWLTVRIETLLANSELWKVTRSMSDTSLRNARALPSGIVMSIYKSVNIWLRHAGSYRRISFSGL